MYVELCFLFNITRRLKHETAVRAVLKHEMKNGLSVRYKKKNPSKFKIWTTFVRSQKNKLLNEDWGPQRATS